MADAETQAETHANSRMVLAFSIILASLIISGSVFFAVGSLNTSLTTLASGGVGNTGNAPSPSAVPTPQAQQPDSQPTVAAQIKDLVQGASFSKGNSSAPVVVVEFSDFQCPFCRRWYNDALSQLENEYINTGKVLFVYQDFPLSFHPSAQPSAEATRCAQDQGKGKEMHDAIFAFQNTLGQGTVQYGVEELKKAAEGIGLNATEFNSCLDSRKYEKAVGDSFNKGAAAGVSGTPSFFIGKPDGASQQIVGAQPYSAFKAAIDPLLS